MKARAGRLGFSRQVLLATGGIEKGLIIAMLQRLPEDAKIMAFGESHADGSLYMWITSDSFKEVTEGSMYSNDITVTFKRNPDGSVICENVDYSACLDADTGVNPKTCAHEWDWYLGVLTSEEYCKKCKITKAMVKP